jgi:hypothetical protein
MPRISIWRLLPRWPLVELPVRLTPGMMISTHREREGFYGFHRR